MKPVPQCPHCGHRLPRLKPKFDEDEAVRRVLKLARSPKHILVLAHAYTGASDIHVQSARRAIHRLAKSGHLQSLGNGMYRTHPRGDY